MKKFKFIIEAIVIILIINLVVSNLVMRFKNPEMTETELFLKIPKAFIWKFEK